MERTLSVTRHAVDPAAVLSTIQAGLHEVFPMAQVEFRRTPELNLLQKISATLPQQLVQALAHESDSAVNAKDLAKRHPGLNGYGSNAAYRMVLPVRRNDILYGAFELIASEQIDTHDLATAIAMTDHLAVKLENASLSSSLGQAGRELESVRTFLEDLIASLPVGIVGISGPELEVRLWNPFEARRTGIAASEVIGKRYLDQVASRHLEKTIVEAIRQRPTEVLSFPNVGWIDPPRGQAVDVTVAPLRIRQGMDAGYVLILVDSTERNALQWEVEEFRRLASLGKFAAAIAHDVRTPLSSICMSVQILRSKVDLPQEDMEYFDLTLEAISRLEKGVEELLAYTKPVFLRVDEVVLHEIVEDARDDVVSGLDPEIVIQMDVPTELKVPIDEVQVRKMLASLIQNAVQASVLGGRIWISARSMGEEVCVVVGDEGKGIESKDLDRIWEPFFTTRTDGIGLGLALVRKTVRAHGGRIGVRSKLGEGTQVEVFFPAKRSTEVVVPIEECCRQTHAVEARG
ncbi:MAG: hypothetical protein CSA75_00770 [Sorangium cellulosum]|nr:MAG: hypothetical protein CSA75_00770 [Sorangium cellulosum]